MKKAKILLSFLLCFTAVVSMALPAYAFPDVNSVDLGSTRIEHTVDATWSAEIPAYIVPEEQGKQNVSVYSVAVENVVLSEDTNLSVSVEYDGSLTERSGVELSYALYNSAGEIKSGSKILTKEAGDPEHPASVAFGAALAEKVKYAGVYTDTAVFNFKAAEEMYTPEEIKADSYLYGIGKTKSEYVVAKYSKDYSEVTIFKNGEDSDGLMKDWQNAAGHPLQPNGYLRTAYIKRGVTSIGDYAFSNCSSLKQVTIPQSVTSIGAGAFYKCKGLTQVTIPQGVTSIGGSVFSGCTNLTQVTIPQGVTRIGGSAFFNCTNLTQVTIPEGVTSIEGSTFYNCTNLTQVTIPEGVTSIGDSAFFQCYDLTEATLPDSMESIGNSAFYKCHELTQVTIPQGVTNIGNSAFFDCASLTKFEVDSQNSAYTSQDGVLFNKEQTELIQYPASKSDRNYKVPQGVTNIRNYAFYNCKSLWTVTISQGVESIGDLAFGMCSHLTQVTIPDSVTSIGDDVFNNYVSNKSSLKIYGSAGSYAQTWAESKGYTFVAQ